MEAVQRRRRLGRAPRWVILALVVLGPAAAAVLSELTWDGEGRLVPAMWCFGVVVTTALAGGLVPGMVTVAAGSLLLVFFFTEPRFSFLVDNQAELSGVAAFVVAGLVICLVLDHLQTSARAAGEAIADRDRSLALLDGLLANAPVGFAFLDTDLRFVRANETLAGIDGLAVADHLGRRLDDVLGVEGGEAAELLAAVRETGRPALDVEIVARPAGSSSSLRLSAGCYPVRVGGRLTGVGLVVRDVTEAAMVQAERAQLFDRVARIQTLTAGLSGAASLEEIVSVVLDQGRRALGACAASLALEDGDGVIIHVEDETNGVSTERVPRDADDPHVVVIRTGQPLLLGEADHVRERFPDIEDARALAVLPLMAEGAVRGAIDLGFDEERVFDGAEQSFLAAVAGVCAAALDRGRLSDAELAARAHAERATARVAFLSEATAALASSLDWETTLGGIADLAVPHLADWCSVVLADGDDLRALRVAHVEPEREPALRRLVQDFPIDAAGPEGLRRVLAEGRGLVLTDVTEELRRSVARTDEHLALLEFVGVRSLLVTPLVVQGEVLGAISLGRCGDLRLGDADLALADEVAVRAAQAIVNARLFEQRTHIAATLQAALIPRAAADIPGLELAARFVAGGEGVNVGGDFYDAFPLDGGRWAVVIGDVRGKGVEAAALTATARNTIRSISVLETSPARMLAHLNEVLLRLGTGEDEPRFCTMAVATVAPADAGQPPGGGPDLCLAVAGHPLPYVLRADGSARQVGTPGTLLGVFPSVEVEDVDLSLGAGDSLVLFTDGVTERHDGTRFFDEAALSSVLSRCAGFTAEVLAERVETAARAYVEDLRRDDLALLVLRAPERSATSAWTSTELPAVVESAARARRFVAAALATLPATAPLEVAELLTSEVVTNAILHSDPASRAPSIRIEVIARDGVVRVSVSDGSPSRPEPREAAHDDEGGRGMALVAALATRWGVEPADRGKAVWFEVE
ncbi:MAG: SpoIIE family protein phosphatase [Acidimicrobiia bacterium]|nr:SpoIIE family protein phosphatase [Acidimicrobiia bacterium]